MRMRVGRMQEGAALEEFRSSYPQPIVNGKALGVEYHTPGFGDVVLHNPLYSFKKIGAWKSLDPHAPAKAAPLKLLTTEGLLCSGDDAVLALLG
jgi:hypothetical protein